MTVPTVKRRRSVRISLAAGLLVLAGLTACSEGDLFNIIESLAYLMETPAPQVGMSVGSGG